MLTQLPIQQVAVRPLPRALEFHLGFHSKITPRRPNHQMPNGGGIIKLIAFLLR